MISLATAMSKPVTRVKPFLFRTLADGDLAQHAVIGVQHAPPGDAVRIDVQAGEPALLFRRKLAGVRFSIPELPQPSQHHWGEAPAPVFAGRAQAVEQRCVVRRLLLVKIARIDRRCQQIVRGGDGVDVSRQMEVELLHRDNLAVAAAGRAAFDTERRTLAGLANAGEHLLAKMRAQSPG